VAIAESHPQRVREAAVRLHVPRTYADYHELLEQPDIDAVTIATPTHLHAAMAIDALKARKHVYLEQPMALNAKEAARIVEAARAAKRLLMVAHPWRFHRHTQLAKGLLDRGDAGEVYHVRASWVKRAGIPRIGSWYTRKAMSGGGCLTDLGLPLIDLALYLCKDHDVATVTAQVHTRFGPRRLGEGDVGRSEADPGTPFDVEDVASAFLRLKSGRSIALEVAWASFGTADGREPTMELLASNSSVQLFPLRHTRHLPDGAEAVHHFQNGKAPPVEDSLHHFVGCAVEGKKLSVPPEDSLRLRQILDALQASAASGKEVRLP
jgi:predicted dehydrogenase